MTPDQLSRRGGAGAAISSASYKAFYLARSWARPLVRWDVPIVRVRGPLAGGGEATVVVAGLKTSIEILLRRLFANPEGAEGSEGNPAVREPLGSAALVGLRRALEPHAGEADLVVARVPAPWSSRLFDESWLRVPEAVEARLEVPADAGDLARASTRARRNIQRIRKSGLTWSVSIEEPDFDLFYEDYYLPFLHQRFDDVGIEITRRGLRTTFRRGFLLWIEHEGRRVAAALMRRRGEVLQWRVMGARPGEDVARLGALSAIYLFGVECAARYGFRWFDMGFSISSPREGVLSHKRSWGGRAFVPWPVDHDLMVRWQRPSEAVFRFFEETPLVIRDGRRGGGLSLVTALPERAEQDLQAAVAACRRVDMKGLDRVYLLTRRGGRALTERASGEVTLPERILVVESGSSSSVRRPGPRVLVLAGDADGNLGDRAILEATRREIRSAHPGAEVTVARPGLRRLAGLPRAAREADLVLCGGGGLFQDDDSLVKMPYWALRVAVARVFARRVAGYALGVGPLRAAVSRVAARAAFACMERVTVRDERARDVAESVTGRAVAVVPDPAIALRPAPERAAGDWLKQRGLSGEIVGVTVRRWFPPRPRLVPNHVRHALGLGGGPGDSGRLVECLARALDLFLEGRPKARLLFLPTYDAAQEGDEALCREVIRRMRSDRPDALESVVHRIADPALYKAVAGRLALMLGGRMHPAILAASMGTPVVGLSYNPKFDGFFGLIGRGRAVLDVVEFVERGRSRELAELMLSGIAGPRVAAERIEGLVTRVRAFHRDVLEEWLDEESRQPAADPRVGLT